MRSARGSGGLERMPLEPGEFSSAIGLAFNSRDEIFVTDLNNARVQTFSTDGQHLGGFDLPRDTPERRSTMIGGIAIDGEDLLYLSFMIQHKVVVCRASGEVVREFGRKGTADGEFHQPGGLLLLPDGNLHVADQCNHRIQKFSRTGEFLAQWGGYGTEPGQFDGLGTEGSRFGGPHFIVRDSRGRLYTTEGMQGRVQQFSDDGAFLARWGDKGDQPGGFGEYIFGNLLRIRWDRSASRSTNTIEFMSAVSITVSSVLTRTGVSCPVLRGPVGRMMTCSIRTAWPLTGRASSTWLTLGISGFSSSSCRSRRSHDRTGGHPSMPSASIERVSGSLNDGTDWRL